VFGLHNPNELSGRGIGAIWPASVSHLFPGALFAGNKAWGAMSQLAKRSNNAKFSDLAFATGVSTSGPAFFQVGVRSNSFSEIVSQTTEFKPWTSFTDPIKGVIDPILQVVRGGMFSTTDSLENSADTLFNLVQTTY